MIEIRQVSSPFRSPESVLDYPQQPVFEAFNAAILGVLGDRTLIKASRAIRFLRQGQLPVLFLPPTALVLRHARASETLRMDEFGLAVHLHLASGGHSARDSVWYYPGPDPEHAPIAGMLCLDPTRLDSFTVDGLRVTRGDVPGSWITGNLRGCVVHRHGAA